MADTIAEIDRIRAVDVPWRMYLILFIILMLLLGLVTGGLFQFLRLPTAFMVLAMISLVVLMVFAFLAITFFGFKEEEIDDAKKLAKLYNAIKVARINQLNNVRAGLKLKNLNLGRPKRDVDLQFLRTYNKFRMQANALAHGPKTDQPVEKFFEEIAVKLDEICFRNAYFLKRLHAQIPTMEEVRTVSTNGSSAQKLELVRFVFSSCILINLFGTRIIDQSKRQKTNYSRLCLDNIQECINRAEPICDSEAVKQLIMKASGCDHSDVSLALQEAAHTTHKMQERVDNLRRVFKGALANLPTRKYMKIYSQADEVEDPPADEHFSFR